MCRSGLRVKQRGPLLYYPYLFTNHPFSIPMFLLFFPFFFVFYLLFLYLIPSSILVPARITMQINTATPTLPSPIILLRKDTKFEHVSLSDSSKHWFNISARTLSLLPTYSRVFFILYYTQLLYLVSPAQWATHRNKEAPKNYNSSNNSRDFSTCRGLLRPRIRTSGL